MWRTFIWHSRVAKLSTHGFDAESLRLIKSYLTNHFQITKVNKSFSSWAKLLLGVFQRSVLGQPLFKISINDSFYLSGITDACHYTDGTTRHACDFDS